MKKNIDITTLKQSTINAIRDLAIELETFDLKTAQELMLLAHQARPDGILIKNKLDKYTQKLAIESQNQIQLQNMMNKGEIAIIPVGFRCHTKNYMADLLNIQQESLPFDSGFFPPSSIVSVLKNPIVNMNYLDKGATHSICIKHENYDDPVLGRGIKFSKSTYSEINSLATDVDIKGIHKYLDNTFGYYTLNLQHDFVLAHYNWHKFAKPNKSKGITDPEVNIQNLNDMLNRRIERMLNMCHSAKYVFFVFNETQGYNYMKIDDTNFDLHDLEDIRTTVSNMFTAQTFVTTLKEVNNAKKILSMLK